ncbi:hypothetical protein ABVT39_025591 [Epinephelus coioides]
MTQHNIQQLRKLKLSTVTPKPKWCMKQRISDTYDHTSPYTDIITWTLSTDECQVSSGSEVKVLQQSDIMASRAFQPNTLYNRPAVESTRNQTSQNLRIVLFGKSDDPKTTLGNFILGNQDFDSQKCNPVKDCVAICREWRGNSLTVVKMPDIFSLSVEAFREELKNCVTLCHPGPNVLLLLLEPSDFTERNRKTLKFILSLFDQDAFKYSMVISTHEGEETNFSIWKLRKDCGGRHYNMVKNDRRLLMEKIENIVHENKEAFLTFTEEPIRATHQSFKPGPVWEERSREDFSSQGHFRSHRASFSLQLIRVC